MNFAGSILKLFGWSVDISTPQLDKCVICVAPHTSNWDFPIGLLAYKSVGRKANFLMKEQWFFWPLKYLFKALGGIAVPRTKGSRLTDEIIDKFEVEKRVNLAVTPEATRSANPNWRKGFLFIATGAQVPIQLGVIDYKHKRVSITKQILPSGDVDKDMERVKKFYAGDAEKALYPFKFKI